MSRRIAILPLAILSSGAAVWAGGCDGCFGTYVPVYETTAVAMLVPSGGADPTWLSRSFSENIAGAATGTLVVRLRGADTASENRQLTLGLPLPLTSGQQVEVEMVAPASDPNPTSDFAVIGGSPLPQGEIRIDDVSGCSTGTCPPSFTETATGGFTILTVAPLSFHVDATVTLASGTEQQIVGDVTFPSKTTEVPGYCVPYDS
jgi:hypothetical protein